MDREVQGGVLNTHYFRNYLCRFLAARPSFCFRVRLAEHSIIDKNSRFFVQLTNAFLAFLALTDFAFEFRCFQWGSHPDIVTADGCVKMQVNQMTPRLAAASRPETTLNFDMSMVLVKLSLVSPVFFGERVQFVLGELEAVGRTPAWVSPANRFFERGVKTERAVVETTFTFKDGQRAKLMDALNAAGEGGISQVDAMTMEELKQVHIQVFDGNSGSRCLLVSDAWLFHLVDFRCSGAGDHRRGQSRDDVCWDA